MSDRVEKTDEEWREVLTPRQFKITRNRETEPEFSGDLWDNYNSGIYLCVGCGSPLFSSKHKYDSGQGWPSFFKPFSVKSVRYRKDERLHYRRLEVICNVCEAHLGHVFRDGPPPTGKRYRMNSAALNFIPAREEELSEN